MASAKDIADDKELLQIDDDQSQPKTVATTTTDTATTTNTTDKSNNTTTTTDKTIKNNDQQTDKKDDKKTDKNVDKTDTKQQDDNNSDSDSDPESDDELITGDEDWDLTFKIAPYLDNHFIFPLLQHLKNQTKTDDDLKQKDISAATKYSVRDVSEFESKLLSATCLIDQQLDLYRELNLISDDVLLSFSNYRGDIIQKLRDLEASCAPILDFFEKNGNLNFNLESLAMEEMLDFNKFNILLNDILDTNNKDYKYLFNKLDSNQNGLIKCNLLLRDSFLIEITNLYLNRNEFLDLMSSLLIYDYNESDMNALFDKLSEGDATDDRITTSSLLSSTFLNSIINKYPSSRMYLDSYNNIRSSTLSHRQSLYDSIASYSGLIFNNFNIDNLYSYSRIRYQCGYYLNTDILLKYYKNLTKNNSKKYISLWGSLSIQILQNKWVDAEKSVREIREFISQKSLKIIGNDDDDDDDGDIKADVDDKDQSLLIASILRDRAWLLNWSLFIFFNSSSHNLLDELIELYLNSPKYLNVIRTMCPYLLRYLSSAIIISSGTSSSLTNLREISRIICEERDIYRDPITEFIRHIIRTNNFISAKKMFKFSIKIVKNDFFLSFYLNYFVQYSRIIFFKKYCKLFNKINVQNIANLLLMNEYDVMSNDQIQLWFINVIKNEKINAKLDVVQNIIYVNFNKINPYQEMKNRINQMNIRTIAILNRIKQLDAQQLELDENNSNDDGDDA